MTAQAGDLWVFGYGSLMWKPGFDYDDMEKAVLPGYARRFCLDSITYRGTPEYPGLVLALDEAPGAACAGVAYRVGPRRAREVHEYLRARELVTYSYLEKMLPVRLESGASPAALCYVMDKTHVQYRGGLTPEQQAEVIATAHGPAGSNREYLEKTVHQLSLLQIRDEELDRLSALVSGYACQPGGTG